MSSTDFMSVYDQILETLGNYFSVAEGGNDVIFVDVNGYTMSLKIREA